MFRKIEIDYFFYIFMIISCLSASFENFFYFFSIIIIHELGHLLMGLLLGWNVDKICLYPYGGVTKFNEDINRKLIEELLILLSGPLFQIIYFLIGYFLFKSSSFNYYNLSILIFNLLPIYPLDGGRILNIFLSFFLSFRLSYYISIIISIFISILFLIYFIYFFQLNIVLMFLIVLFKVFIELKKRKHYFNKFLLERYLNNYNFKKSISISSIKKMMRDKRHIIKFNNSYITEKEYLKKLYR